MDNAVHMLKSSSHSQMMSFIITTCDNKIILIDGGKDVDADYLLEYLRSISKSSVPHVDAVWLTHPHGDHIGAFMKLINSRDTLITFDKVYFNFPSVKFLQQDTEDKDWMLLERFYEILPAFADRINIVSGGDEYDIGGAHVKVFYSTDFEITDNINNNSSLVFKVSLGNKTMLFTGDCGIEAGQKILRLYGKELKSDYCQMSHHGQNGCSYEFYRAVSPSVCFWCTPDWLWNNDAGKGYNTHIWKTVEVRKWMKDIGVEMNYVSKDGTQVVKF